MLKLVLDADGAIKLAKAGVLATLARRAHCLVPLQVLNEVSRGKESMYDDAFVIAALVERKELTVVRAGVQGADFGQGECAALQACQSAKADAIISDDRRFLAKLHADGIPFIVPTDVIASLALDGSLTRAQAIAALERIRHQVREEAYQRAMETIGGE